MKSTFIYAAALCGLSISSAHAVVIVKDHQPRATIVVDTNADETVKNAASTLQEYIRKSTNAALPIANNGSADGVNIYIGETAYTKNQRLNPGNLDQDGFILQGVDAKNFAITGGSDWGTEFGVYDFLERYLGVRWLAGGDLFTDVPQHATVDIPATKIRQEPVILSRQLGPIGWPWSSPMISDWGRFNRLYMRTHFHHNLYTLFPVSKFGKSHPEFYPLINGKRIFPKNDKDASTWEPNFSAPGIVDVAAQEIEKYFEQNPKETSFSLAMNDSTNFDQSPATLARRKELGGLVEEYITFVNDVTSKVLLKYPDKKFGLLAYANLRTPPQNIKFNSHVIPYVTYELSRWPDTESREKAQSLASGWQNAANQIGWYDYFYGSYYMIPRSLAHIQADALRWLSKNNVRYYYAEDNFNFGEGPKDWVQSKLLWDPNQDVDALLNDWYTHAVGAKAAPSLAAYYALWEKCWTEVLPKSSWYNRGADYQPFLYTDYLLAVPDDYITQSDKFLNETIRLAQTPIEKERAEKLQQMWEIYKSSIIARKGDSYWQNADLQTEKQAMDLLNKCTIAIQQSQHRLQLLSDLRNDPLYKEPIFRITYRPQMRGDNWGSTSLWSLLPWVKKSPQVRKGLEEIVQSSVQKTPLFYNVGGKDYPMKSEASEIAAAVLATADDESAQLLKNTSFEDQEQNWDVTGFKVANDIAQTGESSLVAEGSQTATIRQRVPYTAGDYTAVFSAYTTEDTNADVRISYKAVNQHGGQRGGNLPSEKMTLHVGKWSTFAVPVRLQEMRVNDTMSLQITVQVSGIKAGKVYIDDVRLYKAESK